MDASDRDTNEREADHADAESAITARPGQVRLVIVPAE
jgi:hypothetical protein